MVEGFANHRFIRIISAEGNPPEKYVVSFHVRGAVPGHDGRPSFASEHRAEIFLLADYPRRAPFCRMTTPVFHPNIDPQKICIGDHWSAGQSVRELVIRIAEMICYQSYNTKSPLNAAAAAWAELHQGELPLQTDDMVGG